MTRHPEHFRQQPDHGPAARRPMHAGGEAAPHARPANAFEARQDRTAIDDGGRLIDRCAAWPGERQCPRRALEGSTRCGLHPAAYVGRMT